MGCTLPSLGEDEGQVKRPLEDVTHTCFTTQRFAQVPEKMVQISNLPKSWPTNVLTLLIIIYLCAYHEKLEHGLLDSTFSVICSVLRSCSWFWEMMPGALGNILARVNLGSSRWPQTEETSIAWRTLPRSAISKGTPL